MKRLIVNAGSERTAERAVSAELRRRNIDYVMVEAIPSAWDLNDESVALVVTSDPIHRTFNVYVSEVDDSE